MNLTQIISRKEKITIAPMKEASITQYKNFKQISRQLVNNWLYRDKKLDYRTLVGYNFVLVQIPENELDDYKDFLKKMLYL